MYTKGRNSAVTDEKVIERIRQILLYLHWTKPKTLTGYSAAITKTGREISCCWGPWYL